MSIPEGILTNFKSLYQGARDGVLDLVECESNKTGKPEFVVVLRVVDQSGCLRLLPFAKMFTENPFEEVTPVKTGVAFVIQQKPSEETVKRFKWPN